MARKKLPVDELFRLALIFAEDDRLSFADAVRDSDPEEYAKALDYVKQFRAYRRKRWGKTQLEEVCDSATPITIEEMRNG